MVKTVPSDVDDADERDAQLLKGGRNAGDSNVTVNSFS